MEADKFNLLKSNYHIDYEINISQNINREKLFTTFAKSLKFPSYFSRNWDSFMDLLWDLSWLKNEDIFILIKNSDNLLNLDAKELRLLMKCFEFNLDNKNIGKSQEYGPEVYWFLKDSNKFIDYLTINYPELISQELSQ